MAPKGLSSSMSSGIGSGQLLSLFEQLEAFQRPQPLSITVTWPTKISSRQRVPEIPVAAPFTM